MDYVKTALMNLLKPIIGVGGATWARAAQLMNSNLDTIAGHTHKTGDGHPIETDAINIDKALSFNSFGIEGLKSIKFNEVTSHNAVTDNSFYRIGDSIYYKNSRGVVINIGNFSVPDENVVNQIFTLSGHVEDLNSLVGSDDVKVYIGTSDERISNIPTGFEGYFILYVFISSTGQTVHLLNPFIGANYYLRTYTAPNWSEWHTIDKGLAGTATDQTARDAAAEAKTIADANTVKLETPSDGEADAAKSTTVRGWTAALIARVVRSIVPEWARAHDPPSGSGGGGGTSLPAYNQQATEVLHSRAGRLFWESILEVPDSPGTSVSNGHVLTRTGPGDRDYAWRGLDLSSLEARIAILSAFVPPNPDGSIRAATKEDFDNDRFTIYGGNLKVADRKVTSPASDKRVQFRAFATADLPAGHNYRGTTATTGDLNSIPNLMNNDVAFVINQNKLYRYDATSLVLGQPIGWVDFPGILVKGPYVNAADAMSRVTANGQVFYFTEDATVYITHGFQAASEAIYQYAWVFSPKIQNAFNRIRNLENSILNQAQVDARVQLLLTDQRKAELMNFTISPNAVPATELARTYQVSYTNQERFGKEVWMQVLFGGTPVDGRVLLDATGQAKVALNAAGANNIRTNVTFRDETVDVEIRLYDAITRGNEIAFLRSGIAFW